MKEDNRTLYLYKVKSAEDFEDYYHIKSDKSSVLWSGFEAGPEKTALKSHFQKLLSSDNLQIYYLKNRITDGLIGYVQTVSDKEEIEVSHSILEDYQGKGYGALIYELLIDDIKKQGYKRIIAWISDKNIASIKNLLSNGFIKDSSWKEVEIKSFNRVDVFYLYKKEL